MIHVLLFGRRAPVNSTLLFLFVASNIVPWCLSFNVCQQTINVRIFSQKQSSIQAAATTTALYARQARRNLPKRRRRNQGDDGDDSTTTTVGPFTTRTTNIPSSNTQPKPNDKFWETSEIRPLNFAKQKEAGVDYWIDPVELQKLEDQKRAKRIDPGQIPDAKLWTEVLSPYKQNWIGIISVSIIALAFIFKNFPEVINPPIISNIPDVL